MDDDEPHDEASGPESRPDDGIGLAVSLITLLAAIAVIVIPSL
jgi:hypothetical protein